MTKIQAGTKTETLGRSARIHYALQKGQFRAQLGKDRLLSRRQWLETQTFLSLSLQEETKQTQVKCQTTKQASVRLGPTLSCRTILGPSAGLGGRGKSPRTRPKGPRGWGDAARQRQWARSPRQGRKGEAATNMHVQGQGPVCTAVRLGVRLAFLSSLLNMVFLCARGKSLAC